MSSKRDRGGGSTDRRQHGHAAPKPTVDEFLSTQSRVNKVSVDFLKVDLQAALTFASLALEADDGDKRERNRRSARKAYDTITRLIDRVTLAEEEAESLKQDLERLKSDLVRLGEDL
jgi:hypothetical protein